MASSICPDGCADSGRHVYGCVFYVGKEKALVDKTPSHDPFEPGPAAEWDGPNPPTPNFDRSSYEKWTNDHKGDSRSPDDTNGAKP